MNSTFTQLEEIKKQISTQEDLSASDVIAKAEQAQLILDETYAQTTISEDDNVQVLRAKSMARLKELIKGASQLLLERGLDFFRSEMATILSLLLVIIEDDEENLRLEKAS